MISVVICEDDPFQRERLRHIMQECINEGNAVKNENELLEKLAHLPLPKQEFKIIPGTVKVLQTLKDKGFRLGVVSNHRA